MFTDGQDQRTQITTQRSGYVLSHSSFPADYSTYINVTYTITGLHPKQQQIVLVFFKFDVEAGSNECNYDALFVNGVQDANGVKFCQSQGYTPPLNQMIVYDITASTVSFRFTTDVNGDRKGFFFKFTGNTLCL